MRNYDELHPLRPSNTGSDRPVGLSEGTLRQDGEHNGALHHIAPHGQRAFPPDATAIIYRPARSAMTSGKANTRRWKLCFERRSAPFIEPLMGWTGGTDTLSQVELDFPSAEAAIAYAKRQGLDFVVQGLAEGETLKPSDWDQPAVQGLDRRPYSRKLEWVERTLGVRHAGQGIDLDHALANPAAAFDEPERVVRHPHLSAEQKRDILRRWALEAYRTDGAKTQATGQAAPSRLNKVIDALIDLDEPAGLKVKRIATPSGGARAA